MKFRDNLLYLRQQRNMTQEQLAMLLGVSRQSVAKWEAGQSTPEVDKLLKMSELFNCTLDELVNGDLTQRAVAPEEVLPENAPAQDVCGYDEHVRDFAKRIAIGVTCILLGVAVTTLLDAVGVNEDWEVVGIIGGVIAGLAFLIPAGVEHGAFAKAHPFVEDFYTEAQKAEARRLFTRCLVWGIGAILLGVIVVSVMDGMSGGSDDMGSAIMLFLVAAGVGGIVHGSVRNGLVHVENYNREREKERTDAQWERDNPRVGNICGIIMLAATIVGLALLFLSTTPYFWLSWVFGGIACAIVTLAAKTVHNR